MRPLGYELHGNLLQDYKVIKIKSDASIYESKRWEENMK